MFIEIDRYFLQGVATDSDRIPTLYYSKYWPVRKFFWSRLRAIYRSMQKDAVVGKGLSCLDFGGGGGTFLPTLSNSFGTVTCVDLENHEAKNVVRHYECENVQLIISDITKIENIGIYDVIVAADVLEHFENIQEPIKAIKSWMKPGSFLYTSLPTANTIYVLLRKIFGISKPEDHYHTGYHVESVLKDNGFRRVRRLCVPLRWHIFPLFLISTWKKDT